jgi:hypothetical protein
MQQSCAAHASAIGYHAGLFTALGRCMRRRQFITLLGGVVAGSPLATSAQEPGRVYRLGVLIPVRREEPAIVAFFNELRSAGFMEGQNLVVLPNAFDVRSDQIAERSAELIKSTPDAIISDLAHTRALQRLTQSIQLITITEDIWWLRNWLPRLLALAATPRGLVSSRRSSMASGRKS